MTGTPAAASRQAFSCSCSQEHELEAQAAAVLDLQVVELRLTDLLIVIGRDRQARTYRLGQRGGK